MATLHRYNDGSVLKVITARELVAVPIWKGQRILDKAHADNIKAAVEGKPTSLDSGYSIVKYNEENADGRLVECSYLIDGQHRASVIRDYYQENFCESDFTVTVTEKSVESEAEAIEYFNRINNVKAQQWKTEPQLIINRYLEAFEKGFNKNKKQLLIRPGTTARPYLSSDHLREALKRNVELDLIKHIHAEALAKFVRAAEDYNRQLLNKFAIELTQASVKDEKLKERAIKANFALAYDTKLAWLSSILTQAL